jgi:hypothetical protein
VDSGSTINVLPYELGIQLGAVWDESKAIIQLSGNLSRQNAIPLFANAEIGEFSPVKLVFAWVNQPNTPLILGQTNFFLNLMLHSSALSLSLRSILNRKPQAQ